MIRVAIIGSGNISAAHIRGYLAFPERCRVVALVDIDAEKTEARKAEFKLEASEYRSVDALLASERIDLVSICTPPYTHREIAVRCLRAGLHVLCEKPMASSLEECDEMLAAQHLSGTLLSIVSNNRFLAPVMALRNVLRSGAAGRIVQATVSSYWWRGTSYYDLWWRGTWEKEGGGCTLNHGVHHLDLFRWLMGSPTSVTSTLANLAHPNSEVEDYSLTLCRYEAPGSPAALGVVTCSLVHHGEEQGMIFQCERAKVSFPWAVRASIAKSDGFPTENPALERELTSSFESFPPLAHEGHAGQIENVIVAIEGRGEVLSDGMEGRKTLELISAIYQSGVTGTTVKLPLPPSAPFYTKDGILKNAIRFHRKSGTTEFQPKGA